MISTDTLIIGGGAAGMMAALAAAAGGADVILLEKMNKLGKKILATGNGRCNYTNLRQEPSCYRGTDVDFAWTAIKSFDNLKTIELFKKYGIMPSERDGYVYPASGQAASVRNIFNRELIKAGVDIHIEENVISAECKYKNGSNKNKNSVNKIRNYDIKKSDKRNVFMIKSDKEIYYADKLIIATGGKAYPVHGSDGFGYSLAKAFGHTVIKPLPALTACIINEKYTKDWSGARVHGEVRAYNEEGMLLCADKGELQFVASGISGIPVFQVSRYVSKELDLGRKPYLVIDIMPDYTKEELTKEIIRRRTFCKGLSAGDVFEGMLNSMLSDALLKNCKIKKSSKADAIDELLIKKIVHNIKEWKLFVSGTAGFDKAQITCGGIPAEELNASTMESRIVKGLYFAGEIIDVDGICGGYNLQWAWTSGYIAGSSAGIEVKR